MSSQPPGATGTVVSGFELARPVEKALEWLSRGRALSQFVAQDLSNELLKQTPTATIASITLIAEPPLEPNGYGVTFPLVAEASLESVRWRLETLMQYALVREGERLMLSINMTVANARELS
jgi:hypothetical protein